MINNNDQPKNNYVLIKLKKKWKKTERITLAIDLVLLFAFILLSIVKQLTYFNSIAFCYGRYIRCYHACRFSYAVY